MAWYKDIKKAQNRDRIKYNARVNFSIVIPDYGSDESNYDQAYGIFTDYLREMESIPKPADPQTGIDTSMRICIDTP